MKFQKLSISALLCITTSFSLFAQLDTVHWLPPMHAAGGEWEDFLYFSTPETTPFDIQITDGSGNLLQTVTVSNAVPVSYQIADADEPRITVPRQGLNTVLQDAGIIMRGAHPFYVSFRSNDNSQAASLTCKGQNGAGTIFRTGHPVNVKEGTIESSSFIGFMATEDSTEVKFTDYGTGMVLEDGLFGFTPASDTITILLNEGESYVLSVYHTSGPIENLEAFLGAALYANRPIVVNCGSWVSHVVEGPYYDIGIDQIAPLSRVGKEYVIVRGNGGEPLEKPIIVAHFDNTEIYISDHTVPDAVIQSGEHYVITGQPFNQVGSGVENIYFRTSEDVFVYQVMGGSLNNLKTLGLNFIPPAEIECSFEEAIDNIPFIHEIGTSTGHVSGLMIVAETTEPVYVNGSLINAVAQPVLGKPELVTYRTVELADHISVSSAGFLNVGLYGSLSDRGWGGFYSGFGEPPLPEIQIAADQLPCADSVWATANIFDTFDWYVDGVLVDDSGAATHYPGLSGAYYAVGTSSICNWDPDTSNVLLISVPDSVYLDNTLCPGDEVLVNGTIYDANNPVGTELMVGASSSTCDSIVFVDLSFYAPYEVDVAPEICINETIFIGSTPFNFQNTQGQVILVDQYGCDSTVNVSVTLLPLPEGHVEDTICVGDFLIINGAVYDFSTPTGTEFLPNAGANGCDSILQVALSFFPVQVETVAPTLCPDGFIQVNGNLYDFNNPSGQELLIDANGCDSTVLVNLSFFQPGTLLIDDPLCSGESMLVNGTVYDENNPVGTEILSGADANGCDSIIQVMLSFIQPASENLSPSLCPGMSILVNGVVYDENNLMGTEVILGASAAGCDSIVNVNLSYYTIDTAYINEQLCYGQTLTVNGTVYSELNPSGMEVFPTAAVNGCDSVVLVDLGFFVPNEQDYQPLICANESMVINGTTYDASNPVGQEVFTDQNGCDSIVNIALQFIDLPQGALDTTLCPGESLSINGASYDASNPLGTELLLGAGANGCDSLLAVSLSFFPFSESELNATLCPGESMVINGQIYDSANPSGQEILVDENGCDSLVTISLSFYPPNEQLMANTLCYADSLVVNGQVYNSDNPSGLEMLSDQHGCDSLIYIELTFVDSTSLTIDTTLCFGDVLMVNGRLYGMDYSSGIEFLPGGNAQGCDSAIYISLSFYPEAVGYIDWEIRQDSAISVNGTIYDFENPNGQELVESKQYPGCDSLIIIDLSFRPPNQVFIPNVFSPNDDGRNDFFYLSAGLGIVEAITLFRVFDRWGNMVFERQNIPPNTPWEGWSGVFRGKDLNTGIFVYYLEVQYADGRSETFKGDVLLLR